MWKSVLLLMQDKRMLVDVFLTSLSFWGVKEEDGGAMDT